MIRSEDHLSLRPQQLEGWAIFASVAELRSFSAAAEALGLSRPSVSKAIGALEERLGVRLFHRTTRALTLTASGEALAAQASALVDSAQAIEEMARNEASSPSGIVRVAAPMGFGLSHLAPILPDLLESCPHLTIDLNLSDSTVDLIERGIDMALRIGALPDSGLLARRLRSFEQMLVAAPAYLEKYGRPDHPRDLDRHRCFAYSNRPRPYVWQMIGPNEEEIVVRPHGPLIVNNGEATLPALCAGAGIAFLPDFIVGPDVAAGRLLRILPEWRGRTPALHLVTPPGKVRPARVTAVMDFFVDRFAE